MSQQLSRIRRRSVRVLLILGLLVALTPSARAQTVASPSAQPPSSLPPSYASQLLTPEWRAAFPFRSAFGSLCSLGPLACALIDRPFAFNAHLEVLIRPKALDGSTGVLLPFAVSVPLFGRAEVGFGSCYVGFWASKPDADKANADSASKRPSGLCPFWLAAKLLIFPWFRDPHTNPALAVEYLFEYPAGPFGGVNQLGLLGALSKLSLAYRHPMGRLELGAAVSVLVDHTTHAGTVQFGPHVGYQLPIGEHLWFFGQAMVQAPSWGPLIPSDTPGQTLNLAPPVSGTLAVGAQQRADFGFGAGMTLMLTKSELETRVDLLFRVVSFEVGPHIKPLIPAREKRDDPQNAEVSVKPQVGPQLECPEGYQLESAPAGPKCVPWKPSPRMDRPCYLAPLDGSAPLRMGKIDATGQYCEWDLLRLPLGAVIDPPQRVPHSEHQTPHSELASPQPAAPTPAPVPAGVPTAQASPAKPGAPTPKTPTRQRPPAAAVAVAPRPQATPGQPAPRQDRFEHVTEEPPSVPGHPAASGFVDGVKDSYQHARDLYKIIKKHGPGVVIPSQEVADAWLKEVEEQCLNRLDDCARDKAKEAAQALNAFRHAPWEDKQYTLGHWGWGAVQVTAVAAASSLVPGAGTAATVGTEAAEATEGAVVKGVAVAAVKKAGKKEATDVAEHGGEAAVRKLAEDAAGAEAKNATESGARSRVQHEALKHDLREQMAKPHVEDPELAAKMTKFYKPAADVGSGSTAAAVREELATGMPVKGRIHSQKASDGIKELEKWLRTHPNARLGDRAAAENVVIDMKNALEGR